MKKKFATLVLTMLGMWITTGNAVPDDTISPSKFISVNPPAALTEPKPTPSRLWNLQDADIISVINEVSLETGKNFIIDPRVTGKITLVSSKPVPPDQVYNVFLSVLSLLGYSAIPSGDVIKIVPNMESSEYATRVASNLNPGKGDEVVVRVIPLENVSANQLIPVIRPLLPQWSNISAYTPGNVLILVGRAANLQRILTVINNIDRTADNNIEIVPLHQASAMQMSNVLNNLQNAARATGDTTQISIAPDERSNSILLSGNKAARIRMRMLIAQLDTPSAGAKGNTEVIYLKYLIAKSFAPILGKIAQNIMGKDTGKDTISTTTVSVQQTSASSNSQLRTPENMTNIQAEPSTNSLIITAPPAMMTALNSIVAKLDIRPAQVLIEGILVEINQDDLKNLGIQWGGLVDANTPAPGPGFSPFGQGVIGIIPSMQVQAILNMLQTKADVNILSTPSVVVLDNHSAFLDVGQDVPVTTGNYATTGNTSTVNPFTTTGYKKVTLSLKVTPQINLGDMVRLSVILKNDSLQNPDNPGPTPLINTSQITNSVLIRSCDILVLGGLMRDTVSHGLDKIPILGDIPIVGAVFQRKTRRLEKTNLVVFLKPIIMRSSEDANALTYQKYEMARTTQINWPQTLSAGEQKAQNILPLWHNSLQLPKPFQ